MISITIHDNDMPVFLQDMSYFIYPKDVVSTKDTIATVKEHTKILFSDWKRYKENPKTAEEYQSLMEGLRLYE